MICVSKNGNSSSVASAGFRIGMAILPASSAATSWSWTAIRVFGRAFAGENFDNSEDRYLLDLYAGRRVVGAEGRVLSITGQNGVFIESGDIDWRFLWLQEPRK